MKKKQESVTGNSITTKNGNKDENVLALVVDHFQEVKELKSIVHDLQEDINTLVGGETKLVVSSRRGMSISNKVVKNRKLCETDAPLVTTQKCGTKTCMSCPLMTEVGQSLEINKKELKTPLAKFNCKTKNAIYVAQCQLCPKNEENTYVGQTTQPVHKRINGHRSCFVKDKEKNEYLNVEKSALSLHNYEQHCDNMDLNNFKFVILNSANPCTLDRKEARAIGELRTNVFGLNRMNIQK